ncbi:MAG: SprT-like domain-containing protein [Desulfobacteraceae bacterium]|nr:SprT-like domain-containing protein [Desulfobacteraceae bacterium]
MPSHPADALQALEHRILYGLSCEWDAAVASLPAAHRTRMRKPMFRLGEMSATLGYWSADQELICISRHLAVEQPWGDVREVLLHEMAHQLVDQWAADGARLEPPHGKTFRQACRLLRADPAASVGRIPLSRRIFDPAATGPDPVSRKIRKLLALAGSENPHEAHVALTKARRLIEKHNVPKMEERRRAEYVSLFVDEPALRHFRDEYHLASLLLRYYFVEGVWVSAFVRGKAKMGRVLEISGTPCNVRVAAHVYDCVRRHIQQQWRQYRLRNRISPSRRTDFAVGLVEGFRQTLEKAAAPAADNDPAAVPVPIRDPALQAYLADRYPRTVRVRQNRLTMNESVWAEGMRRGKCLVIHKAVDSDGDRGKMLPGGQ